MQLTERQFHIIVGLITCIVIIMFIFKVIHLIFRIIRWFFRSIWYLLTGRKRQSDPIKSDDWLTRAQARQEIRFQNSLPPLLSETKPKRKGWRAKREEKKEKALYESQKAINEAETNAKFANNPDWYWDDTTQLWRYKPKKK